MPDRAAAGAVAVCLALAALSLLLPWALAFDPWSWVVWGREVTRFELDTAGGPSWKPLPVVVTTVLTLAGGAAPALWLVLARAGGALALVGAAVLAGRLAGAAAAGAAALSMGLSSWWLFNSALGNSEGLLAAAALWAVVAHLRGAPRAALALGVAAALLRPEAWPLLGLYALWLWRTERERTGVLALALAPVPLLWFGPDALGVGGAIGASGAARGTASPQSAVYADVPALEVLVDFAELVTVPVLLLAVAGAAIGGRTARALAAGALAWVALVALMTQAGFAGNPRYNVVPGAFACVLAGVGVAAAARRLADLGGRNTRGEGGTARARLAGAALAGVLAAATLAFTAGDLGDQLGELGDRADRRAELDTLVDRAGGAAAIVACAAPRTVQPMKAMLAWRLDVAMERLADPPRAPATVFRVPPGYAGEPPGPPLAAGAAAFERVARAGDWTLLAACR